MSGEHRQYSMRRHRDGCRLSRKGIYGMTLDSYVPVLYDTAADAVTKPFFGYPGGYAAAHCHNDFGQQRAPFFRRNRIEGHVDIRLSGMYVTQNLGQNYDLRQSSHLPQRCIDVLVRRQNSREYEYTLELHQVVGYTVCQSFADRLRILSENFYLGDVLMCINFDCTVQWRSDLNINMHRSDFLTYGAYGIVTHSYRGSGLLGIMRLGYVPRSAHDGGESLALMYCLSVSLIYPLIWAIRRNHHHRNMTIECLGTRRRHIQYGTAGGTYHSDRTALLCRNA